MRLILITILTLFFMDLNAQDVYIVLKVKGMVYADGKLLQPKDKITHGASLKFGSQDAVAYLQVPGKGNFVASPKKATRNQNNEFIAALKDALMPPLEFNQTSQRNFDLGKSFVFKDKFEMVKFFKDRLLVFGNSSFEVAEEAFDPGEGNFFLLEHHFKDGHIGKLVPVKNRKIEFNEELANVAGVKVDAAKIISSKLYYYESANDARELLGEFQIIFSNPKDILSELTALRKTFTGSSDQEFLMMHALPYLNAMYGNTHPQPVLDLLVKK